MLTIDYIRNFIYNNTINVYIPPMLNKTLFIKLKPINMPFETADKSISFVQSILIALGLKQFNEKIFENFKKTIMTLYKEKDLYNIFEMKIKGFKKTVFNADIKNNLFLNKNIIDFLSNLFKINIIVFTTDIQLLSSIYNTQYNSILLYYDDNNIYKSCEINGITLFDHQSLYVSNILNYCKMEQTDKTYDININKNFFTYLIDLNPNTINKYCENE